MAYRPVFADLPPAGAPAPSLLFPNRNEGAPGPSLSGTGGRKRFHQNSHLFGDFGRQSLRKSRAHFSIQLNPKNLIEPFRCRLIPQTP